MSLDHPEYFRAPVSLEGRVPRSPNASARSCRCLSCNACPRYGEIVGVLILVGAVIGAWGLRVAILRYFRAHPHLRKPIDTSEDRRKAKPWIVSQVIGAVLVVPLMVTTHGAANVVFATGVIFWLVLTPVLRLVGYLAGRARRLL
jgi:hypothetical protein